RRAVQGGHGGGRHGAAGSGPAGAGPRRMKTKLKRFLLVNGPNLNTLGTREPQIYGTTTLEEIVTRCTAIARDAGVSVPAFQPNHDGALLDFLQQQAAADGAIINPGGLAHTSVVLRDAVAACKFPLVEVRIRDV